MQKMVKNYMALYCDSFFYLCVCTTGQSYFCVDSVCLCMLVAGDCPDILFSQINWTPSYLFFILSLQPDYFSTAEYWHNAESFHLDADTGYLWKIPVTSAHGELKQNL